MLGAILAACGGANNTSSATSSGTGTGAAPAAGTPKKGGTLRVATQAPSAAVNPLTVADSGGLAMLNQTGEFLAFDNNLKLTLEPMLALSWSPNSDGSVWTFKLRPGVTFHNGQAMTADDVVYSWTQYSDPKNASSALSAIGGVLLPSGVQKVDDMTVAFHLEAPNGNFPYLVSSDTYNAIIVPNGTDFGKWQSTFIGTGAFKLKSYTQNVGAEFVANPSHWGGGPYLDGTNFTFYTSQPPQILALQGGQVDVITQFVVQGAQGLLNNSSFTIITLKSSNHRELSMRNDQAPFTDVARAPGRRAEHGPHGNGGGPAGREGQSSATTAPSRRCSPPPTRRSPSARRTSRWPSSCCRPPGTRTASTPRSSPRSTRRSRSSRR